MKTIVVPTDFSTSADNALNYAIELALQQPSKIILLHSLELDYASLLYTLVVPANETFREQAVKQLDQLTLKLKRSEKLDYECIVREEDLAEAVLSVSNEKKADLIVMGTKGAKGLMKIFFGSNAATIIEKAHCPVIAVPEKAKFKGLKHIAYASNYHPSDLSYIRSLVDLAKPFHSQINVLHVAHNGIEHAAQEKERMQDFMEEMNKHLDYTDISYQLVHGENVVKRLDDYLDSNAADLLVLSTEQRMLIEHLADGSVAKELVYHTKIPLMVFHHAKPGFVL